MQHNEIIALNDIVALLEKWTGCPFSRFKQDTLVRRIERRMAFTDARSYSAYLSILEEDPRECQRLLQSITIKVSAFFRDPEVFAAIEDTVLPLIFEGIKKRGKGTFRAWCAACATGEEAYSLGILVLEHLRRFPEWRSIPLMILGTDIDHHAVKKAKSGIYHEKEIHSIPERFRRYFRLIQMPGDKNFFEVVQELRDIVQFSQFNCTDTLYASPPGGVFAEYDLILLRNVLIYYDNEVKVMILKKVADTMKPSGFLVLGRAEAVPETLDLFTPFIKSLKIYRKKEPRK